jgi:putative ABC transport system permease protein
MVVAEVALAFVLLTGAGLLMRSFFQILHVDAGFDSTNVITAGPPISEKRFQDPAQLNAYLRRIVSSLQSLPGVRDVALTSPCRFKVGATACPFKSRITPSWIAPTARAAFSRW